MNKYFHLIHYLCNSRWNDIISLFVFWATIHTQWRNNEWRLLDFQYRMEWIFMCCRAVGSILGFYPIIDINTQPLTYSQTPDMNFTDFIIVLQCVQTVCTKLYVYTYYYLCMTNIYKWKTLEILPGYYCQMYLIWFRSMLKKIWPVKINCFSHSNLEADLHKTIDNYFRMLSFDSKKIL